MTERDENLITRLVEWITSKGDSEDVAELCDELNIDETWCRFYEEEGAN